MQVHVIPDEQGRIRVLSSTSCAQNGIDSVMVEVDDHHGVLEDPSGFLFKNNEFVKDQEYMLSIAKEEKDEELNMACNEAILNGFDHIIRGVEYHFSFDIEAQFNFQGTQALFQQGFITEIEWTVQKDGAYTRVLITNDIMNELILAILYHKNNKISYYRDTLTKLIEKANTLEEVEAIYWGMEEPTEVPVEEPEVETPIEEPIEAAEPTQETQAA